MSVVYSVLEVWTQQVRGNQRRQYCHEAYSRLRGGGKIIVFTVKIRCHKNLDVADELNSASIDLADNNLNFELKGINCVHDEAGLMVLMTYNTMREEYTE